MKKNRLILLMGMAIAFSACKKKDKNDIDNGSGESRYIISAVSAGSASESSDYLLVTDNVKSGTLTTVGSGIEQDGYREYLFNQNKVFSFIWGYDGVGPFSSYTLNNKGELTAGGTVNVPTAQVLGVYGTELYGASPAWAGGENNATSTIFRIDAASANTPVLQRKEVNLNEIAGNGEMADFYSMAISAGKLYVSYKTINADYGTAFKDNTWIAIYSYPGLVFEKVITDNRTSYINYRSLYAIENGDVYGFSSADGAVEGEPASTKPSGVIRIKSGASEYDQTYFFNVQEKSGGYHINRAKYFGSGKFLLSMYAEKNKTGFEVAGKLAIVDINAQSFQWVADAPTGSWDISYASYTEEDGHTILAPYVDGSVGTYIYSIDANTATATRGVKLDGVVGVRGIGKLKLPQ